MLKKKNKNKIMLKLNQLQYLNEKHKYYLQIILKNQNKDKLNIHQLLQSHKIFKLMDDLNKKNSL